MILHSYVSHYHRVSYGKTWYPTTSHSEFSKRNVPWQTFNPWDRVIHAFRERERWERARKNIPSTYDLHVARIKIMKQSYSTLWSFNLAINIFTVMSRSSIYGPFSRTMFNFWRVTAVLNTSQSSLGPGAPWQAMVQFRHPSPAPSYMQGWEFWASGPMYEVASDIYIYIYVYIYTYDIW